MSLIAKSNVLIVFLSQNYDVNDKNMIQHISRKLKGLVKLLVTQFVHLRSKYWIKNWTEFQ